MPSEVQESSEIKVLEFLIGKLNYGINALRIKQVIQFVPDDLNPLPGSRECVLGTIVFQGESIPVVDLSHYLSVQSDNDSKFRVILICEFNNQSNGFIIDNITWVSKVIQVNLQ